jgi:hypothetical protein
MATRQRAVNPAALEAHPGAIEAYPGALEAILLEVFILECSISVVFAAFMMSCVSD